MIHPHGAVTASSLLAIGTGGYSLRREYARGITIKHQSDTAGVHT